MLRSSRGDFSEAGEHIARRLSAFMRTLRDNALAVGLEEGADAAQVLASPLVARRDSFRSALKTLACARRSDWLKFDAVFDAFWLGRGVRRVVPVRAALNDPDILRQCITGCESLEMQSPTDMTARAKLAVGPVRATFSGKVKLTDIRESRRSLAGGPRGRCLISRTGRAAQDEQRHRPHVRDLRA